MSAAPAWYEAALRYNGAKEITGSRHEPLIVSWWKAIKRGGIKDDETPWCAAFVGACLEEVGLLSTRFESARSYLTWGVRLTSPTLGCVVVLTRQGGGHVGFFAGYDRRGNWVLYGGNQGDKVGYAAFPDERVAPGGIRWPEPVPSPTTSVQPFWASLRPPPETTTT